MSSIVNDVKVSGDMVRFLSELQKFSENLIDFAEYPDEQNHAQISRKLEEILKSIDSVMEGEEQTKAKALVAKIDGNMNAYFDLHEERHAGELAAVMAVNDFSASMEAVSAKTQSRIVGATRNTDEGIKTQATANEEPVRKKRRIYLKSFLYRFLYYLKDKSDPSNRRRRQWKVRGQTVSLPWMP